MTQQPLFPRRMLEAVDKAAYATVTGPYCDVCGRVAIWYDEGKRTLCRRHGKSICRGSNDVSLERRKSHSLEAAALPRLPRLALNRLWVLWWD